MRAIDNVNNSGAMSVSVPFATKQAKEIFNRSATSLVGFQVEEPWGLENEMDDDGQIVPVFSDSPRGDYENNINVSLSTDSIPIESNDLTLRLNFQYMLEQWSDYLWIEVLANNQSEWKFVSKVTGPSKSRFIQKSFQLNEQISGASSIRLRFRLKTDQFSREYGVLIRNISLFARH